MNPDFSIIDLFAGPGGLGEGFSSYRNSKGDSPFKIALSVEKEASAHKTLELRSFFRHFRDDKPVEYYRYLRGEISKDELFRCHPHEYGLARTETMQGPMELGNETHDREVHQYLKKLKKNDSEMVVIGGPPCQAYSVIGRVRNRGIRNYKAENDRRHFLYEEYLKVLDILNPAVFIMENVKGILTSKANGSFIFPKILDDLSNPAKALNKRNGTGYRIYSLEENESSDLFDNPEKMDFIIKCENHGIPQTRHRVILLGVREDINEKPGSLKTMPLVKTKEVLYDLPVLRSGLSRGKDTFEKWAQVIRSSSKKVKAEFAKIGLVTEIVDSSLEKALRTKSMGSPYQARTRSFRGGKELEQWYLDKNLEGFVNHFSRTHMPQDITRYLFASCYALMNNGISPRSKEFPKSLAPDHVSWEFGDFVDRFKVQAGSRPSSTITSHIAKDGHYYIHYDPSQCRSLTVREAARLQTFPDNYHFEGNRTQQYTQVGNAVPPLLAAQIADIVYGILKRE